MVFKVIFLTLSLAVSTSYFAQTKDERRRPISNISDATWEEYKAMYGTSKYCSKEEITLWSCETSGKTYLLCSSTYVRKGSGYIQYRVAANGKTIFTYPSLKTPPFGSFSYQTSANGDASLDFSHGGFDYSLMDSMRGKSQISVTQKEPPHRSSQISCKNGNQTLQVNYTMRLMFDAGIWSDY